MNSMKRRGGGANRGGGRGHGGGGHQEGQKRAVRHARLAAEREAAAAGKLLYDVYFAKSSKPKLLFSSKFNKTTYML